MTVDTPKGFYALGVSCGLKKSGPDLALVRNFGPLFQFSAVFTQNEVKAAPVLWSQQIAKTNKAKAVLLNSGGANACTGSEGFSVTHSSAEYLALKLGLAPIDIAVCSTGIIGEQLDLVKIRNGIDSFNLNDISDGLSAATAIMTTDSRPKQILLDCRGFTMGGMAKGAGMLHPSMATMLAVFTTDADLSELNIDELLFNAVDSSFNRISSDGCMSTNDTVILMASGATGFKPNVQEFSDALNLACLRLAEALIDDAEGSTAFVEVEVQGAIAESQALQVARKVANDSLVKTAIFGRDPNWGRVAAAAGAAGAQIDPDRLDIYFNDIPLCLKGVAYGERNRVDISGDRVTITIRLNLGLASARILTTDLSTQYVTENSEYST
jgi:glutamate N-acetyltransferase/amino-acid N-acetyltransferase